MTNPYYAHTSGVPAALTRAASSQIRNEYDLIEDGFDLTDTAIDAKANIDSPTFTGTVTVPTPLTAAAAATKAYVDALSVAAGNVPTGGSTGQYLKKNSVTDYDMSWGSIVATVAGDITATDWSLTTSTAVGVSAIGSASLDADRTLFLFAGSTSAHAAVYNATTDTWGSPVLIRTANIANSHAIATIATDKVLLSTIPQSSTALETVVLTVSALVITVNTALATTLAASGALETGVGFVTVGSSYIITYANAGGICCHRAITVSGTTPSIGAELVLTGYSQSAVSYAVTSSVMLTVSTTNTFLYALPITVSGTSLTAGTQAIATVSIGNFRTHLQPLSSGRWIAVYVNTTWRAAIVNVSGTTATLSAADTGYSYSTGLDVSIKVFGAQTIIKRSQSSSINVATDNAGTIVLGTAITTAQTGPIFSYVGTSVLVAATSNSRVQKIGISGNNPVLESDFVSTHETTYSSFVFTAMDLGYGGLSVDTLRTSAGKTICATSDNRAFCLTATGDVPVALNYHPGIYGTRVRTADDTVFAASAGAGNVLNIRRLVLA